MQHFQQNNAKKAETDELAVDIFGWMAAEPELLGRFLALTGLTAQQLRGFTQEPGFAAAVIGFIAAHEPTLLAFCRDNDVAPEVVARAWQRLEYENGAGMS